MNERVAALGRASDEGRKFVEFDRWLDLAQAGPTWLSNPQIAASLERAIFRGAELGHYALFAYVIMPNHVHILVQPWLPLARLTNALKGVSSRDANAMRGRIGTPFWQDESFDHWVRSAAESERIQRYIEWNPVKAGLASKPERWRWSSAYPDSAATLLRLKRTGAAVA